MRKKKQPLKMSITSLAMEKIILEIRDEYFKCKKDVNSSLSDGRNLSNTFISRVNTTFSSLSKEEQEIISNDFFYESYEEWWATTYHKKLYLKIKEKAMSNFLETFYGKN